MDKEMSWLTERLWVILVFADQGLMRQAKASAFHSVVVTLCKAEEVLVKNYVATFNVEMEGESLDEVVEAAKLLGIELVALMHEHSDYEFPLELVGVMSEDGLEGAVFEEN